MQCLDKMVEMFRTFFFFFGCAGSSWLCGLFFSCGEWNLLFLVVLRLLVVVASLVEDRL